MDNVYLLVKDILATSSSDEARQILYGLDGLDINSNEYYENIVSSFVRKKDIILSKLNKEITYDLNKDIQDLWDIMFISQYVKKIWTLEQEKIRQELNRLKSISPITEEIRERISSLNLNVTLINTYFQKLEKSSELSKVKLLGIDSINQNSLDFQIKELKKAILIFQKLRDSFEHRNNNLEIGELISINNERNYFKITIPVEYIDGFNKGRIIAKEADKDLVSKTNAIVVPILEYLGYDEKKMESFFYNINPEYLDYLLKCVNNDISELYKLPFFVFEDRYKKQLELIVNSGIKLSEINNFPMLYNVLFNQPFYLSSYICFINYCKNNNLDYKVIYNDFPFCNFEKFKELYESGIKFEYFNYLSPNAYYDLTLLRKEIININDFEKKVKNLRDIPIGLNPATIEEFNNNISVGFTIRRMNEYSKEKGMFLSFRALEDNVRYFRDNNIDINSLSNVAIDNIEIFISYLKNGEEFNIINSLSDCALKNYKITKLFLKNSLSIEYINNLKEAEYKFPEYTILLYKTLQEKGISKNLKSLEYHALLDEESYKKIIKCIETLNLNEARIFELSSINISLYDDSCDYFIELLSELRNKNISITTLNNLCYGEITKQNCKRVFNLLKICEQKNKNYDLLKILPGRLLLMMDVNGELSEELIAKYEKVFDLLHFFEKRNIKLNERIPDVLINASLKFEDINNPSLNIKYDNLAQMLDWVNDDYTRLSKFPIEFFNCNIDMIRILNSMYNENICKSIFGIDNPKIIASLVYANSVLSKLDKSFDFDSLDIDVNKMIHGSYNDTIKYSNQLTGITITQEEYLTQFIYNDKNEQRDLSMMKELIVTKFRNSSAHFRFKPIKDESGNIIEDKIFLYDECNDGNNNFNLVINLNDLVDIVRKVEISYQQQLGIKSDYTVKAR